MTLSTGWTSAAGLDKDEKMYLEFTNEDGDTAEFHLAGENTSTIARDTTSIFILTTSVNLSKLKHIQFKFLREGTSCFITYIAVAAESVSGKGESNFT